MLTTLLLLSNVVGKPLLQSDSSLQAKDSLHRKHNNTELMTIRFLLYATVNALVLLAELCIQRVNLSLKRIQWNPDFSNTRLFETPDSSNQSRFPWICFSQTL